MSEYWLLDIFLIFFGTILIIFFITGLVYIARYEVGIRTKTIFGAKMPQGQIIARNGEIGI